MVLKTKTLSILGPGHISMVQVVIHYVPWPKVHDYDEIKFYYESNSTYYEGKQCTTDSVHLIMSTLSIMKANIFIMKEIILL